METTGWDKHRMKRARVNGEVKFKKDGGFFYVLESISSIHLPIKENMEPEEFSNANQQEALILLNMMNKGLIDSNRIKALLSTIANRKILSKKQSANPYLDMM